MVQDGRECLDETFVYEEFSGIRSAFEQLIDRYGYEAVEETMTKVVNVLEKFEMLVSFKRQASLRLTNSELVLEEEKEANFQQQQILNRKIGALQEQNESLNERNEQLEKQLKDIQNSDRQTELSVPTENTEAMDKLNDVIAVQAKTVNELREEYEELSTHSSQQSVMILKLKAGLQESVYCHKTLQVRNDRLCNELAALEAQLAALELERGNCRETRARQDSCAQSDDRSSWDSLEDNKSKSEESPEDRDILQAKLDYKRSATQVIREVLSGYSPGARRGRSNKCMCDQSGYKFTVEEMTLLINERNIAKEKLVAAEEELSFFRERDGVDVVTEEGFAILDPPRGCSTITRTLFDRVSRPEDT